MPRFAANLGFLFTEHEFLDRFDAARAAGFRAVEFSQPYAYPAAELAARLRANGLECILVNLPMGDRARGDFGIACRPGREAEFRAGVAKGIEYAHALGVPKLNCICGTASETDDPRALRATLIANLRFAAREFKAAGLDLVLEPINTHDIPGFLVSRSPEAVALIEEVGAANLHLQCDLYHTAMMGDDPAAILRQCRSAIRHVQFADVPGRGEPGSGRIDFAPLFALLDELGYGGWVSAEYRPTRPTVQTLGFLGPG
ncbi:MAG TPA: TIM barrel protein [Usitatibacter sp.]|nr:TIM barrel protein [Usitatibacter sp.]